MGGAAGREQVSATRRRLASVCAYLGVQGWVVGSQGRALLLVPRHAPLAARRQAGKGDGGSAKGEGGGGALLEARIWEVLQGESK